MKKKYQRCHREPPDEKTFIEILNKQSEKKKTKKKQKKNKTENSRKSNMF